MKKVLFITAIIITNYFATAQTIDSVKQLIIAKKLIDAKTEIDLILAKPENSKNADAWYFKGYIYNLLSKDTSFTIPLTNVKAVAFNAFVTCLTIKPNHKWIVKDNFTPLVDIYQSFFTDAKYNYATLQYDIALNDFINAEKVGQFLYQQKVCKPNYCFIKTDTNLLYNIAATATKAHKEYEAMQYYAKLADAKLNDPQYLYIYHTLVDYYIGIKDEIACRKYLKIGAKLFPYDNYWVQAEMDIMKASKLNDALIKEFDEKIKATPNNYDLYVAYCKELLRILFQSETKPTDYEAIVTHTDKQLQICATLQKTGIVTELLCSQFYYKCAINATDSSTKNILLQKALPYTTTVFEYYNTKQNINNYELDVLKNVTTMLITIYNLTHNETESINYTSQLEEINKKVPIYQKPKKT